MSAAVKYVAAAAVVAAAAIAAVVASRSGGAPLEVASTTAVHETAPEAELCPWRQPGADMHALFADATGYATDLLILSRLRQPILRRLGAGGRLDSNALYIYRVAGRTGPDGVVVVRRTAGQYGAIEVVTGIDTHGNVTGVRLQRLREPPEIASAITSPAWLASFKGKTADSPLQPGIDLPSVSPAASADASAVARAVRSLLVEYDVGKTSIATHHHHHA